MADRPVIVRTHRGLGNQLFQYAAGLALAGRLDAPLRCDASRTIEPVLGPCLGDHRVPATARQLWSCGSLRSTPSQARASRIRRVGSRVLRRPLGLPPRRFEVAVAGYYDPGFERLQAPTYLLGFFQHQGYWADVIDHVTAVVCGELDIADPPADPGSVVGIHVRRGDYLAEGRALGPTYYRRALQTVAEQIDQPILRVFSADRSFADDLASHLQADGFTVDRDRGSARHADSTVDDLIRLAECDHLVTSNSSYAWWGAALGDHVHRGRRRLVVLPNVWIEGEDSAMLRRPDWVAVSACADPRGDQSGSGLAAYLTSTTFAEWWLDIDDA
jgi:hypothetical protein